ncbi:peptidase M61 [Sphingorhabdus lutea]|uniref:Peptidase M61 n=1 Tax=Sphingorhabdus lutea TaxID=1913578 RepID=A0A1L3JDH5_9SPHN|nr:M61 family metallopeptidase [Sphingorhabdus lutea]APG63197.1 peptidase M61 [Sphingorhabdus lutea]
MKNFKYKLSAAILPIITIMAMPTNLMAQAAKSAPQPIPLQDNVPKAQDIPYPATMILDVDATDISRAIFNVKQTIPVKKAGKMTLLYPEWLPGKHAPRGAISEMAGLKIMANGKLLNWTRDPLNVYAFHIDVPSDNINLDISFQFLSPIQRDEGRITVTNEMMNIQWEMVALYPAGYFTRQIPIKPSVTLPTGWTGIAALDGAKISNNAKGVRIDYDVTDFETFVDSPMFAGKYYKKWDLGHNVTLNVVADDAKFLEAKDEHIAVHRNLVEEAVILFGAKHFDRYEFLLGLTEKLGGVGLEHHRSSENTRDTGYFTKWDEKEWTRGLLPHELVHSWNGKYRRPEKLWTPDFDTPMQDNLLWVYEGQTSFWDLVLGARSGIQSKELVLGEWARYAAYYATQPGREWRSVEDTTHDPIIAARKAKPFSSWQRNEDYYNEGSLVWLATDMKLRELSGGNKSLDDFAKAFFGVNDGDWGQLTYNFDTITGILNDIAPYDWAKFLHDRIIMPNQAAPLEGIIAGGYQLVWKDTPNVYDKQRGKEFGGLDLSHSIGITIGKSGEIGNVIWNSPAFNEALVAGTKIIAVGDLSYSTEAMSDAMQTARDGKTPIKLIVERAGRVRTILINYHDGIKYPHLEKIGEGETALDLLLTARRSQ